MAKKAFILFLALSSMALAGPAREKGVSAHMLPKSAADLGGGQWGFVIAFAPYLKPGQTQPVIQSIEELLGFMKKQDRDVLNNGLWIVVTNPAAYTKGELDLLDSVKQSFRQNHIPLFVCRGSELPNGWKRYDL
jgi:hypothetical protein